MTLNVLQICCKIFYLPPFSFNSIVYFCLGDFLSTPSLCFASGEDKHRKKHNTEVQ